MNNFLEDICPEDQQCCNTASKSESLEVELKDGCQGVLGAPLPHQVFRGLRLEDLAGPNCFRGPRATWAIEVKRLLECIYWGAKSWTVLNDVVYVLYARHYIQPLLCFLSPCMSCPTCPVHIGLKKVFHGEI